MQEANLDRADTYLTNAVKHFKYEWKGKRRLHQKPRLIEVHSCLPWLHAEIQQVAPEIIVCLGATAAQSLLGNSFRITRDRGKFFQQEGLPWIMATMHPSSILRAPDDEQRQEQKRVFIADLKLVVNALTHGLPDASSNKAG
jgi:uracil-DNA glycosylase family 4